LRITSLEEHGRKQFWLILIYDCGNVVEGLRKSPKILNEDSRPPGGGSK
jgi:hypothetical protein